MFTGLVEEVGEVKAVRNSDAGLELRISCGFDDLSDGDSIAVNGVCLTVRERRGTGREVEFVVAAVATTLERTSLTDWQVGTRLNLERALKLGDRLGGHIVQGHVDGTGTVLRTALVDDAWLIDVAVPEPLRAFMVPLGSVTIDGVSLTINAIIEGGIQLSIIEFTLRHTTLGILKTGDRVHIEADVLAKHVANLVSPHLAAGRKHG